MITLKMKMGTQSEAKWFDGRTGDGGSGVKFGAIWGFYMTTLILKAAKTRKSKGRIHCDFGRHEILRGEEYLRIRVTTEISGVFFLLP